MYVGLFKIVRYPSDNEKTTHVHIAQDLASLMIYINSKKLTDRQLSLPHGMKKNVKEKN